MIGWALTSSSTLGVLLLNAGTFLGMGIVCGIGIAFLVPLSILAFRGLAG